MQQRDRGYVEHTRGRHLLIELTVLQILRMIEKYTKATEKNCNITILKTLAQTHDYNMFKEHLDLFIYSFIYLFRVEWGKTPPLKGNIAFLYIPCALCKSQCFMIVT